MPLPGGWRPDQPWLTAGLPRIPCAQCERAFPLARWGDLCPECLAERRGRASRLAQRIALGATALFAVYMSLRLPTGGGRFWAVVAVVAVYFIVRRIAMAVAMEYLPRRPRSGDG